ncbi:organic cation transporter protein [Bemisia tabaci]|uniref:organic cation transporter protein n=1 Tax=Bemisia tabaci TaxID=7038 RepID=UPI003B27C831
MEDPVEKLIGEFGPWQARLGLLMALLKLPICWFQLNIIFIAPTTPFWCIEVSPNTGTQEYRNETCWHSTGKGATQVKCNQWEYDRTISRNTIISQWDLVCDRAAWVSITQMTFMLGVLLGNIIFGVAADRVGRKYPLLLAIAMQAVCGCALTFVPWFELFLLFRFILALATGGTMVISFVLCMEVVGGKWRTTVPILYQIPFGLGHCFMAGFAFFLRDWRQFQFALALISSFYLGYIWVLSESPRWLLAVGRQEEAIAVLEKAALLNGRNTAIIAKTIQQHYPSSIIKSTSESNNETGPKKATMADVMRSPTLRTHCILVWFGWFACGLSFFGFSQFQAQLGGNIFVNVILGGLLGGVLGPLACIKIVHKCGRRHTIIYTQLIAGVALLMIALFPRGTFSFDWPRILLALTATLSLSITFPAQYLMSGEIFPTVVRNMCIGTASMFARLGSMIAPFTLDLTYLGLGPDLPLIVFGILPILCALTIIPLPETKDLKLPDTIVAEEKAAPNAESSKH